MEFSTQEDIDTPISEAFGMLSSFASYEQAARQRGAQVERSDTLRQPGVGMKWTAQFELREQPRTVDVEIITHDPPDRVVMALRSPGFAGDATLDLLALGPGRTRVTVHVAVNATSLKTRILLKSLTLTKSSLDSRFEDRVGEYLKGVEQRYQRSA